MKALTQPDIPIVGGPDDGKTATGDTSGIQKPAHGHRNADGEYLFHTYRKDGDRLAYIGLHPIGEPADPVKPVTPFCSPALRFRSGHYPDRFNGRVPSAVRTLRRVGPEGMICMTMSRRKVLALNIPAGEVVPVWVNSHGAVAAILPGVGELGLRPDEFDVVDWHDLAPEVTP